MNESMNPAKDTLESTTDYDQNIKGLENRIQHHYSEKENTQENINSVINMYRTDKSDQMQTAVNSTL